MATAYIGLGSNLGERLSLLKRSLELLQQQYPLSISMISPLYETEPVGGPLQGLYLNACAAIKTALSPVLLLRAMQEVEIKLGRVRTKRWGPRTLDLDLLLYDTLIMHTPTLILPHPRMTERLFVLSPLSDIAPDLVIPGTRKTVSEFKAGLDSAGVKLYKENWA
ncbi:MAG TPA: 2-amino-4-hydroxy-6-hydroxymethyldihydropteridine diphosphokinase [Bacillota bacterium]|nr:2-amino-4-hydroxy-6-hydroxymethyldihydropteridine diphosphokinase [Bacillota bacterium]